MEDKLASIKEQLHASAYKLTPQREATVLVLIENEKKQLSAEDVYLLVKDKAPEIGLATVYRTLELLSDLKIIEKITFGDGVARYDLNSDATRHFQHYLICDHCNDVEELEDNLLIDLENIIQQRFQFNISHHSLKFHGICYKCQQLELKDKDN